MPARVLLQDFTGVPAMVDLAALRDAMADIGGDPARIEPLVPGRPGHRPFGPGGSLPHAGRLRLQRRTRIRAQRRALPAAALGADGLRRPARRAARARASSTRSTSSTWPRWSSPARTSRARRLPFPTRSSAPTRTRRWSTAWACWATASAASRPRRCCSASRCTSRCRASSACASSVSCRAARRPPTSCWSSATCSGRMAWWARSSSSPATALPASALADRATISNMSPEYGATAALFPIDAETLTYLRQTGPLGRARRARRGVRQGERLLARARAAGQTSTRRSSSTSRPSSQRSPDRADRRTRCCLPDLPANFRDVLPADGRAPADQPREASRRRRAGHPRPRFSGHRRHHLVHQHQQPDVMVGAGLLARNALRRGLNGQANGQDLAGARLARGDRVPPRRRACWSRSSELGFGVVGYGCTTCIGNSGPLDRRSRAAYREQRAGRCGGAVGQPQLRGPHPPTRARELPCLAAAGGRLRARRAPSRSTCSTSRWAATATASRSTWPISGRTPTRSARRLPAPYRPRSSGASTRPSSTATSCGAALPVPVGSEPLRLGPGLDLRRPAALPRRASRVSRQPRADIEGARVLAVLGDSVTTDHISPAGSIPAWSPAGAWLQEHGVAPARVQLVWRATRPARGDDARHVRQHPAAQRADRARGARTPRTSQAATRCSSTTRRCATRREGVPLLVIAGREYGSGSSRDWAAKGTALLGVRAVLAESYERIHRSNLVGMGVLPLQFKPGQSAQSLGLTGREEYDVLGLSAGLGQRQNVAVRVRDESGERTIEVDRTTRRTGRARVLPPGRHPAGCPSSPGGRRVLAQVSAANGRLKPNSLPPLRRGRAHMRPPSNSASRRQTVRPMPTPLPIERAALPR